MSRKSSSSLDQKLAECQHHRQDMLYPELAIEEDGVMRRLLSLEDAKLPSRCVLYVRFRPEKSFREGLIGADASAVLGVEAGDEPREAHSF